MSGTHTTDLLSLFQEPTLSPRRAAIALCGVDRPQFRRLSQALSIDAMLETRLPPRLVFWPEKFFREI